MPSTSSSRHIDAIDIARVARSLPDVVEAFRTGGGAPALPWEPEGRAEWNRAMFLNRLGREWLPAIEPVDRRLRADPRRRSPTSRAARDGRASRWPRRTPRSSCTGCDLDPDAIALASEHASGWGVADRVRFSVADASEPVDPPYDLVTILEALHDMTRPVDVLRAAREMLTDEGSVVVADERVAETFTAPASERDRYVHGLSVVSCLPEAMGDPGSAVTGAVMRAGTLRRYADEAGFREVEVLPIQDEDLRFYRLVP